jgi:GNAT superfamily N-acetyltransferase
MHDRGRRAPRILRRLRRGRRHPGRWSGEGELAPAIARIGELHAGSPPDLVYAIHIELLEAFGRSVGFGFYPQPPLEPPSESLISVRGRFDRRAYEREFGAQLFAENSEDGGLARMAWVIELYLPERCRRRGAGTGLMEALLRLWEQVGVDEVRVTTVGDGQYAFPSWGFESDPEGGPEDGLMPLRLVLPRNRQSARSGSTGS